MSDAAEKQQKTEFVSNLGLEKDMTAEQYRVAIKLPSRTGPSSITAYGRSCSSYIPTSMLPK